MTKQLVSVAPRQTAKVIALMWLAFTIPFVLMMAAAITFSSAPHKPPIGFLVLMPVLYAAFGYLFTLFGAWLYNVIAKRVGGIEFTTIEVSDAVKPQDTGRFIGWGCTARESALRSFPMKTSPFTSKNSARAYTGDCAGVFLQTRWASREVFPRIRQITPH